VPYKDKEKAVAYNRDYQRVYMRAYRAANKGKFAEQAAARIAANREHFLARKRAYYAANREEINAKRRITNALIAVKERRAACRKKQYEKNPNINIEYNNRRREARAGRPKPSCCEVCGRNDRPIIFDHSHNKHHFRGWLCSNCNVALGMVRDDPNVLLKLAAYLKRTKDSATTQLGLPSI